MEDATELYVGAAYRSSVWITARARKEREKLVQTELEAQLEVNAMKGFQDCGPSRLRNEGNGVWAFGTRTWTTRIAGFFVNDATRDTFVIGGVWAGKSGRGGSRPPRGDAVADRVARLKREGVNFAHAG